MRDQYAGDVSDFLKFAFLRALARSNRTLGVAWYYAPGEDGRADGRHLEWRDQPSWKQLDPELHLGLSTLFVRSVIALETAGIWPAKTLFHREPIPSRSLREIWGTRKRAVLDPADLVFLDPDNGLGIESKKHATFSEVRSLRRRGRSIIFITFPGKSMPHAALAQKLHNDLREKADVQHVITLRTNVSVPRTDDPRFYVQRQRWFTIVDPDAELIVRARQFADILTSIPRTTASFQK